jgi:hypothetical protein
MSWFSQENKQTTLFLGRNRRLLMISLLHVSGYLTHYEGAYINTMTGE